MHVTVSNWRPVRGRQIQPSKSQGLKCRREWGLRYPRTLPSTLQVWLWRQQVRNFVESVLCDLRETWMRRMSYVAVVPCSCDRPCPGHNAVRCQCEDCLHFLNLDQCLANKVRASLCRCSSTETPPQSRDFLVADKTLPSFTGRSVRPL